MERQALIHRTLLATTAVPKGRQVVQEIFFNPQYKGAEVPQPRISKPMRHFYVAPSFLLNISTAPSFLNNISTHRSGSTK